MNLACEIRPERPGDQQAIHELTRQAFENMDYAAGDEQQLVDKLRALGALSLSLVATQGSDILGHVAFSPAATATGEDGWFALGPVSVRPDVQRRGIGSALVTHGLGLLRQGQALGCILVGHLDYYPRFGFKVMPRHAPELEPADHFMVLSFSGPVPHGRFSFHPAFYDAA